MPPTILPNFKSLCQPPRLVRSAFPSGYELPRYPSVPGWGGHFIFFSKQSVFFWNTLMYTPAWGLLKHIQKPPHGQTQTRPSENLLCKTLHFWRSGVTFQTCPAEKIYKPTAPKWVPIWGPRSPSLCDETKILTETETFYPRQILPIPILRLFFSETKFSDTGAGAGDAVQVVMYCRLWCTEGYDALQVVMHFLLIHRFLSDPGVPGVRSMGPVSLTHWFQHLLHT